MPLPRPYVLEEANYKQLREHKPNVAVLPWGATEAHNFHLPHGTDVIEATTVAQLVSGRAPDQRRVAVARNGEVVPRSAWATTELAAGDAVEVLAAVAGG